MTLMRNGRDRRSGKPVKCHARKERVRLFGTRSADYIRASGQSGRIQRPNTWLHPNASLKCPIFPLHRGRRPYMALSDIPPRRKFVAIGLTADIGRRRGGTRRSLMTHSGHPLMNVAVLPSAPLGGSPLPERSGHCSKTALNGSAAIDPEPTLNMSHSADFVGLDLAKSHCENSLLCFAHSCS